GKVFAVAFLLHLHELAEHQPRCVQRLQEIMSDGRKEPRLEHVGSLGNVARTAELDIGMLELRKRVIELLGPLPDLRFLIYRSLEKREGIRLMVHRMFDALHQRRVNLAEFLCGALKVYGPRRGSLGWRAVAHKCSGVSTEVANAIPVKVWFKCMA